MTVLPADVIALIEDFTGDEPCQLDHHGYCQQHYWFETEPACPHARAKQLLANTTPA
ncbi:hypothetical protein [Melissospora conviva]|uniref:hypothetical protein n=1 Tax=Melissospora conviva TaxID=3388432 RepID=UPI003C2090BD